jgi:hypothetical protein
MTRFRRSLLQHRLLAAWLVAAALAMKLLVPAGYMPMLSSGSITLELCSGYEPPKMAMAMPGMPGKQGHEDKQGKMDMPCPFAGLTMPGLVGADAILLIAAISFIMALGFPATPLPPLRRITHLRPPLRGPPTAA